MLELEEKSDCNVVTIRRDAAIIAGLGFVVQSDDVSGGFATAVGNVNEGFPLVGAQGPVSPGEFLRRQVQTALEVDFISQRRWQGLWVARKINLQLPLLS